MVEYVSVKRKQENEKMLLTDILYPHNLGDNEFGVMLDRKKVPYCSVFGPSSLWFP